MGLDGKNLHEVKLLCPSAFHTGCSWCIGAGTTPSSLCPLALHEDVLCCLSVPQLARPTSSPQGVTLCVCVLCVFACQCRPCRGLFSIKICLKKILTIVCAHTACSSLVPVSPLFSPCGPCESLPIFFPLCTVSLSVVICRLSANFQNHVHVHLKLMLLQKKKKRSLNTPLYPALVQL